MLSTAQLRTAWAPACNTAGLIRIPLHGTGVISIDRRCADAYTALNVVLKAHGYRTRKEDTGAYNCRRITGGKGYSLHAYGIAADLNWSTNPYGKNLVTDMPPAMVADIRKLRTRTGKQVFRWGGDYQSVKDAMHFEVVVSPADLATGIDPATMVSTVVGAQPVTLGGLKPGDKGPGVRFLQGLLNIVMRLRVNVLGTPANVAIATDGDYGAQTKEAVAEFQRFARAMQLLAGGKHPIEVTGVATPETLGSLAFWVDNVLGGAK